MSKHSPALSISNVENTHIAVVRALWNFHITEAMLEHALTTLRQHKCQVQTFEVSGTYEIPFFIQMLLEINHQIHQKNPLFIPCSKPHHDFLRNLNGVIALGCVIKGETDHNFYINQAVANQLQTLMLHYQIPISFGIITALNEEQAKARVIKGKEAAEALLHLLSSLHPLLPDSHRLSTGSYPSFPELFK